MSVPPVFSTSGLNSTRVLFSSIDRGQVFINANVLIHATVSLNPPTVPFPRPSRAANILISLEWHVKFLFVVAHKSLETMDKQGITQRSEKCRAVSAIKRPQYAYTP